MLCASFCLNIPDVRSSVTFSTFLHLSILRIQIASRLEDKSLSEEQKKNARELESKLASEVKKLGLKMGDPKELARQRRKAVLAKCFHKIGIVVPYDKTTELGYRPLPMNDSKL